MPNQRCTSFLVALTCVSALFAGVARGADPKAIDDAIRRGKEYLYSVQKNGTWEKGDTPNPSVDRTEPDGGQWGGTTALCAYALLSAGETHEDARLKSAIDFLLKANMRGVYAVAMRTQVWSSIPRSDDVKKAMQKDLEFFKTSVSTTGGAKGFYDYLDKGPTGNAVDHSVSQFGVLGAWSLGEYLEGFGNDYWKLVDDAWRSTQQEDGAWAYHRAPTASFPKTIAMTAAGVATLFITQDFLNRGKPLDASGNIEDKNIDKGIKWINDNYKTMLDGNRSAQYYPYYGLYGVERIGVASGYRFLGDVDWYKDGAEHLVKLQHRSGYWPNARGTELRSVNTALALLFLARGRAPVVMNKLDYDITTGTGRGARVAKANWNQRPRDAANLAKFVGRQAERALNWQIVDFKASPEEMLDAPILYISGNQAVTFTPEQKLKLKQFVEQGGLILAHADAASGAFSGSIRRLATELFKYEFRALPATHPIYTAEQFQYASWRRKPNVLGLSNGVRELVLLLPDGDYARFWQAYDIGARSELFELIANVFQYSVDKQSLRNKGESYLVQLDESIKPNKTIKVARLKYAGNWDPEPAGWTRLAAVMNNEQKLGLLTSPLDLAKIGASTEFKIAHLTGTSAVRFTAPERDALKTFVNNGGVLIVDAAGGATQFAQAVEQEFETIFGEPAGTLKQPLAADHAIYTLNDRKIAVAYRPFAQRTLGNALDAGRIRGMRIKGKPAIFYSPEDLSAGLVGQQVDGITGYQPATATQLMSSMLRHVTSDDQPAR